MTPPAAPESTSPRPGWTDRVPADGNDDPHVFPCDSCGADQEYFIGKRSLRCPFCGYVKEIPLEERDIVERDYQETLHQLLRRSEPDATAEGDRAQCSSCSAEVVFEGSVTSSECAYCGSPIQRAHVHLNEGRIPVDGVLPFSVDKTQAKSALGRWMGSLWFAPGKFKKQAKLGRFEGVYLPYWTFDTMTFCQYSGQRGDTYTVTRGSGKNRRTEVKVRWTPKSGRFQRFFDDVLTLAARNVPIPLLRKLEPWPLERCVPFQPEYLAGLQARTYDNELHEGFEAAEARIQTALQADVRARIGGDRQRIHSLESRHDAITFKHLLLPLWLLTYRYGSKTYQVVVNAETAAVHGERPWSVVKILLAILAAGLLAAVVSLVSGR